MVWWNSAFRSCITKTASLIRLLYTGIRRARNLRADSIFWKGQSRWSRCDHFFSLTSKTQFLNNYVSTVFARTRIQRRRVNSLQGLNSACPVCNFFLSRDPESIKIHECTAKSKVIAESRTSDFESKKNISESYHASGMGPNSPVQPFLPTIWRKIPSEPFRGRPRSARLYRS